MFMLRAFNRRLSRFSKGLRSGDNQGKGGNIYQPTHPASAVRSAGYPSDVRAKRSLTAVNHSIPVLHL